MSSVFSPRILNRFGELGWKGLGRRTRPGAGTRTGSATSPQLDAPPRGSESATSPGPQQHAADPGHRCTPLPAFPRPRTGQGGKGHHPFRIARARVFSVEGPPGVRGSRSGCWPRVSPGGQQPSGPVAARFHSAERVRLRPGSSGNTGAAGSGNPRGG